MLDQATKQQVTQLFEQLESEYLFDIKVKSDHESRNELVELFEGTASCSPKISVQVSEGSDLEVSMFKDGQPVGIVFRAVPTGHEFTTLLLAILNADGKGKNLPDEMTSRRIKALNKADIKTYVSLTCTNCPDVAQALGVMAILNPNLTSTIIDGAINQEETNKKNIQAVPAVFVNDKMVHVGRSSLGELLEKLEEAVGADAQADNSTPVTHNHDVIVVGAGPAGASAAIYSARKGLKVAVVAAKIGGQVNETVGIENLISVPYTTGKTLASDLRKHMEAYDIELFENRQVQSMRIDDDKQKVIIAKGNEEFKAPILIIATGASWRKLNVEGESEYIGRGVAFCPHCDGPFYKGKHVAVVGGGNSGIEAAIDLAGICSKVTVLEFLENLKADTVLQEKAKSLSNVEIFTNVQTMAVEGDGQKVNAIKLKNRSTEEISTIALDGIFVQIGLSANSQVFAEHLETNRMGEIITDNNCRTAIDGIYAAGDVSNVSYKQIIISMGEGAKAALSAFEDKVRGKV